MGRQIARAYMAGNDKVRDWSDWLRVGGAVQRARLFSSELRQRAVQRRMAREADQYFATSLEHLVGAVLFAPSDRRSQEKIDVAWERMRAELALWGDGLGGELSAADFTLFPEIALGQRIAQRNPGLTKGELLGSRLQAWKGRIESLAIVQKDLATQLEAVAGSKVKRVTRAGLGQAAVGGCSAPLARICLLGQAPSRAQPGR